MSNITHPKVLMFYLAVLPQFLAPGSGGPFLLLFAVSHALLSLAFLLVVASFLHRIRAAFARRPIRRTLDAITGVAMLSFGAGLALERN